MTTRPTHGGRRFAASLVGAALALTTVAAVAPAYADPGTISVDLLRTAWDQAQPRLTPSDVTASDFGQVFSTAVDGQVYAQPIVAAGTLVVATENNKAYGLDPVTGAVRWTRDVGAPWPAATVSCGDLVPNIGITSTPVYDSATNAVYFTSKVNDGPDAMHPHWYLHAVDPTTGVERSGWPITIQGSPSNDPTNVFNPATQHQRPGLLLMDGVIYAGFGAHCDRGPYRGYVVGVSTGASPRITAMWATQAGTGSDGAGIWQAGSGLMSDGPGRIFVSTGNGIAPPPSPGTTVPPKLSESVIRLQVQPDGSLRAVDFFSPANADTLDLNDTDISSGGPIGLPDSFGTPAVPHLAVQQGKDGRVFLLDRDDLGGRAQGPGGTDKVVGVTGPYQGQWGHPAVWGGDGGYVYTVGAWGPLRAFKRGVTGTGLPALSQAGATATTYGYTTGSPVISSSGTTSGSATLWMMTTSGPAGGSGTLRAFNPVPDGSGIIRELWNTPIGTQSKFAVPLTYNGRVYIGTRDGAIKAYGRPATTALTGGATDLGTTAVGTTKTSSVVLTATTAVTVSAVSAAAPFAASPGALPVTLAAGQTLTVPVSFSPTLAGSATGTLSVTTGTGAVGFGLRGTATSPGFTIAPNPVTFVNQPAGSSNSIAVQFSNTGAASETITSVSGPGSPYVFSGAPAPGTVVPAGGSFIVSLTYAPTVAGTDSASISVTSTSGTYSVPVTGNSIVGTKHLSLVPSSLDFGNIPVGTSRTLTFEAVNDGNLPVTITKAKAPVGAFGSTQPMGEGLTLPVGESLTQTVTFTPTAVGVVTDSYLVSADDGQGPQLVTLTGAGTVALPAPTTASWSRNGSAAVSGSDVVLNPAVTYTRGSTYFSTPIPSAAFTASFTSVIGGGTGADGLTLALADATASTPATLGATGGGLGLAGTPGVGVALKTTYTGAVSSSNVAGVVTSAAGSTALTWVQQKALGVNLRSGTHAVVVTRSNGHLVVTVDGTQVLDSTVALPPSIYLGFTGASGSKSDQHAVRNVSVQSITTSLTPPPPTPTVLVPSPASVDAGSIQVGATGSASVVLTNTGTVAQSVTAVSAPSAPFAATMPVVTTPIAAGASISIPITFSPTASGSVSGSLSVTTQGGTVTVPLTGTGAAATVTPLVAAPASVAFGSVQTGATATQSIVLTNNASVAQTISARTGPSSPLSATLPAVGAVVAAGASVTIPVTFAPTATGAVSGSVSVTTQGGTVSVPVTGTGTAPSGTTTIPAIAAGPWTFNGSTALSAGDLVLNPAVASTRGSAFYATAIPSASFTATFTTVIGGGTGADGLTLALIDATTGAPTSLGAAGGGLGLAGVPGVGIGLKTTYTSAVASSNVVGVVTSVAGSTALTWTAQKALAVNLRTGTHTVVVTRSNGHLTVSVDGVAQLDVVITLPPSVYLGFTGASGAKTDQHTVRAAVITYG